MLDPLARLARGGFEVTLFDVEPAPGVRGRLDPEAVAKRCETTRCSSR